MKHTSLLRLSMVFGVALALAGCGGSSSGSHDAAPLPLPPVVEPPIEPPVDASLTVTSDPDSTSSVPSSVVATLDVPVTSWTSGFFTLSGSCTTLPTPTLVLDAGAKVITATLSGGVCAAGQDLTLTIDPNEIVFAEPVGDHGAVWTRTYTIPALVQVEVGGTISGLTGTLVLRNNGGDDQTISTDGHFTFPAPVTAGDGYAVTVNAQPVGQTCSVGNGSGTAGITNIADVTIVCSTNAYATGGTVSGLNGSVVLENNGADPQVINVDGAFTFATSVAQGATYSVTVQTQPAAQTCTVSNGSGVMGAANVTNVSVVCSTNAYMVGGVVSGLSGTVELQNNGTDNSSISSNGSFTFSTPVAEGSTYNVTVQTQPAAQTCTVSNGSGTLGGSNVTNVVITCATDTTTLSVDATGTIPVNASSASLTVTNTGINTAYNVSAALPGGWTGVTQDATNCPSIAPGDTCTLTFTSTTPYVAQGNISVTGDNISSPPTTALAFTVDGYLVFDISGADAVVIDSSDVATERWGANLVTNANSLLDGAGNTATITNTVSIGTSAAVDCYNSTSGGAAVGTWYLPAICEMGESLDCAPGSANIDTNLMQLDFGGFTGHYWSSTEYSSNPASVARVQLFGSGGGSAQLALSKNSILNARCVRSIAY